MLSLYKKKNSALTWKTFKLIFQQHGYVGGLLVPGVFRLSEMSALLKFDFYMVHSVCYYKVSEAQEIKLTIH